MPSTRLRKTVLTKARHVVVKLGTQILTDGKGKLNPKFIASIVEQVVKLSENGYTMTVVSSGAIGAGCGELRLKARPTDVAQLQAVAAVGQRQLMTRFHEAFNQHGYEVAQLLVTRGDFDDRVRYLNFRNCVTAVHKYGCIPIINENDSVSVDELRFGDNDVMAALVCNALKADALILLSVIDGLLDADGNLVDLVENVQDVRSLSRDGRSALGSGGMHTKLDAVESVTNAGEIAVIANGREPNILSRLLEGEKLGTVFVPATKKMEGRKRWIGLTSRPAGYVVIDDGAARALVKGGKSLLAIGITHVHGRFARGVVMGVRDSVGNEIARGLTNYSAEELTQIMGKRSNQFSKILNRHAYAEVIHRDNLVVTDA